MLDACPEQNYLKVERKVFYLTALPAELNLQSLSLHTACSPTIQFFFTTLHCKVYEKSFLSDRTSGRAQLTISLAQHSSPTILYFTLKSLYEKSFLCDGTSGRTQLAISLNFKAATILHFTVYLESLYKNSFLAGVTSDNLKSL